MKVLTRRWNKKSEKECEKDDEKDGGKEEGGRRKNLLVTVRYAEQQLKVRNTDEKRNFMECQTSTKFIFGNHPRKIEIREGGSSEENPSRNLILRSGLRGCQTQGEEK